MKKIFVIDGLCYLRQYVEIGCKVSQIKSVEIIKVFDKKIQILVTFNLDDEATATRCCFYFSRDISPTPSAQWHNFGDITLPNGKEATLFARLSDY